MVCDPIPPPRARESRQLSIVVDSRADPRNGRANRGLDRFVVTGGVTDLHSNLHSAA
jgi:hypothetical protein